MSDHELYIIRYAPIVVCIEALGIVNMASDRIHASMNLPYPDSPSVQYKLESIEGTTDREITIESDLNETNLAKCHPQHRSPLYQIPTELRQVVFDLATQPHYDGNHMYDQTDYRYRSGHRARHLYSTGLLQTCRRIWLETNALPMRKADPYHAELE